jgi:hypothetical protein
MGRNQRIGLIAAAVVVAVVAVIIATSGGADNGGSQPPTSSQATTSTGTSATVTTFHLQLKDAAVVGGPKTFTAKKDDIVRIVVSTNAPDQVHLHGYDIEKEATPSKPAVIRFKANIEGSFELESHTAEHEGLEPLVAHLHVEP